MLIGPSGANTLITNNNESNTSKFKIAATGKAFQILSNSLYTHKVRAVVREIGCNAYDAHIDANTTSTPFDVHLPTMEEPNFVVRDYGIGLSPESFVSIYTTYFGSSKGESPETTGGLGLGSKTPFIMSKTFMVISYFEGMEYLWNSYVNDNGEPDVTLLSEKETDQPNGLKVIVPIGTEVSVNERRALCKEFEREAKHIYQWFDVKPNVVLGTTGEKVAIEDALDEHQHTNLSRDFKVHFYPTTNTMGNSDKKIYIKMGNVVYPFDLGEMKNFDRFGGNTLLVERIIEYISSSQTGLYNKQKPFVLEVPMGAVEFAPSREALSLTTNVELTIVNALVEFMERLFKNIQIELDKATSVYEAHSLIMKYQTIKEFPLKYKGVNLAGKKPIWAFVQQIVVDKEITRAKDIALEWFDCSRMLVRTRVKSYRSIRPVGSSVKTLPMYQTAGRGEHPADGVLLIDTKVTGGSVSNWIDANYGEYCSLVILSGLSKDGKSWIPLTAEQIKPFRESGHPKVVLFSELKKKPIPKQKAAAASTATGVAKETVGVLKKPRTTYNPFTLGNTSSTMTVNEIAAQTGVLTVAFARRGTDITSPLITADDRNTLYNYSRSTDDGVVTGRTSYSNIVQCALAVAGSLIESETTPFKKLQVIWTSANGWNELIEAKIPHVFTMNRLITEFIPKYVPNEFNILTFGDTNGGGGLIPLLTSRQDRTVSEQMFSEMGLDQHLVKYIWDMNAIREKVNNSEETKPSESEEFVKLFRDLTRMLKQHFGNHSTIADMRSAKVNITTYRLFFHTVTQAVCNVAKAAHEDLELVRYLKFLDAVVFKMETLRKEFRGDGTKKWVPPSDALIFTFRGVINSLARQFSDDVRGEADRLIVAELSKHVRTVETTTVDILS